MYLNGREKILFKLQEVEKRGTKRMKNKTDDLENFINSQEISLCQELNNKKQTPQPFRKLAYVKH